MLAIIFNPAAGRGRVSRAALHEQIARYAGDLAFEIIETKSPSEVRALARVAISHGADIVAAAGGDGTMGEVLNAVHGTKTKLGVLPLGTGNDFARTLGIGNDLDSAIQILFGGHSRTIDIGRATYGQHGEQSRLFLNIAGCGFDSLVARRINAGRTHPVWKHISGVAAYLAAATLELQRLRPARLRLRLDGELLDTCALLCAVANAKSYGGGMQVAPDAQLDDGLFDICVIQDASKMEFARAFPGVFRGAHVHHPRVVMRRARKVELWCDRNWPILVDGELIGTAPMTFEIVPRAVEVMANKPAQNA